MGAEGQILLEGLVVRGLRALILIMAEGTREEWRALLAPLLKPGTLRQVGAPTLPSPAPEGAGREIVAGIVEARAGELGIRILGLKYDGIVTLKDQKEIAIYRAQAERPVPYGG